MKDGGEIETTLTTDSYDSIAFKGSSTQYLDQVISDVLTISGGNIYPPAFATWREPKLQHGLLRTPQYQGDGRLSPAEAIAIKIEADEGSAVSQNIFLDDLATQYIIETVGIPGGWPTDFVGGMARFGYGFVGAANVRERMLTGEQQTPRFGDEFGDRCRRDYQTTLQLDGFVIGKNTVSAIVKHGNEIDELEIRKVPEGAKTETDIQNRIASRRRGLELGARIYQQVLEIVTQRGVPTKLEQTVQKQQNVKLKLAGKAG